MSAVKIERDNGQALVELTKYVGENCELFDMDLDGIVELTIDFDHVNYINSVGIKNWILWTSRIPKDTTVKLKNCRPLIVNQANTVNGFFPNSAKVVSFYVPYFSDETSEETLQLLLYDVDYLPAHGTTPMKLVLPDPPKDKKGNKMELDVMMNKYFRFLEFS